MAMAEDTGGTNLSSSSPPGPTCDYIVDRLLPMDDFFRSEQIFPNTAYAPIYLGRLVTAAYMLVILFGTTGNALTILAVLLNPAMRTTRNFFILNLALSDFLICTVTAPITLHTVLHMFWPFGRAMCKMAGSLQGFNIFLSTFSITAIALDRYVLVIFPTKRDRQRHLSLLFFSTIWVLSLVFALPLLIASDTKDILADKGCSQRLFMCHEQNEIWHLMPIDKQTYTVTVLVVQYALPLVSMAFVYLKITQRMKMRLTGRTNPYQSSQATQRRRSLVERQKRTNLLLVCVVVVFAVAWLPLNLFHIAHSAGLLAFHVPAFVACHLTAMGSACLNPVFYAFFNTHFRQEFISMFERTGLRGLCCSKTGETATTTLTGSGRSRPIQNSNQIRQPRSTQPQTYVPNDQLAQTPPLNGSIYRNSNYKDALAATELMPVLSTLDSSNCASKESHCEAEVDSGGSRTPTP